MPARYYASSQAPSTSHQAWRVNLVPSPTGSLAIRTTWDWHPYSGPLLMTMVTARLDGGCIRGSLRVAIPRKGGHASLRTGSRAAVAEGLRTVGLPDQLDMSRFSEPGSAPGRQCCGSPWVFFIASHLAAGAACVSSSFSLSAGKIAAAASAKFALQHPHRPRGSNTTSGRPRLRLQPDRELTPDSVRHWKIWLVMNSTDTSWNSINKFS